MSNWPLDTDDSPLVPSRQSTRVAKCPACDHPFHYSQPRFNLENDEGYCVVQCEKCGVDFILPVLNARDVRAIAPSKKSLILEPHEVPYEPDGRMVAADILVHNLGHHRQTWTYRFDAPPLYTCAESGTNLDAIAGDQLTTAAAKLDSAWPAAEHYLLANSRLGPRAVLVRLELLCSCGKTHLATFYADPMLGVPGRPDLSKRCLLADVRGSALEARLDGIASKNEIMDLLEKLVIRWHLTADRILITAPFVGHPWMKRLHKQAIWEWLLSILDPGKALLVTRPATRTDYKKVLKEDGLDYDMLRSYGLEHTLISAGVAKQDFHAKVYAGISTDRVEVLSGSANLVRGPSVENTSFRSIPCADFERRYLSKLNVEIPARPPESRAFTVMEIVNGQWRGNYHSGAPV